MKCTSGRWLAGVAAALLVAVAGCGRASPVARARCATAGHAEGSDARVLRALEAGLVELAQNHGTCTIAELATAVPSGDFALPAPATDARSAAQIAAERRTSVVVVGTLYDCDECDAKHASAASGFFVTADGVLITAAHVIDGRPAEPLAVMTADAKVRPVRGLLALDRAADVAVLRVAGSDFAAVPLAPARVGAPAHVLGHPAERFWLFTSGVVARAEPDELLVTAEIARGSSGAPVFDDCGNAIGMVTSTESVYWDDTEAPPDLQMVLRFCVPAGVMQQLLLH